MDCSTASTGNRQVGVQVLGLCLCLALLLPVAGCISHDQIRAAEGHSAMALIDLNHGDTAGAITKAKAAVKSNRWDAKAWHTLGLTYFAAELPGEAEKSFVKALKLQPDFSQAQVNLGSLYLETKRWDDAIIWLQKAATNPEYRQPDRALHNLGWAWFNKGEYGKARENYRKVLRQFQQFCPALLNLGMVDEAEGKVEDALKRYQQAVECDPADLKARLNLGIVEGRLDMLSDACEHLNGVKEADPYGELHDRASDYLRRLECDQFSKM